MDIGGVQAQRLLQNLVHERRYSRFQRGVGLLALDIKDDFLADLGAAAFFAQFLNRLGAQAVMLLDDGVDSAGRGQDNAKTLSEQQAEIALLHLPGGSLKARTRQSSSIPSGRR